MLTFIMDINATSMASIITYGTGVVGDLLPIMALVVAIDVAFIIYDNVMSRRNK